MWNENHEMRHQPLDCKPMSRDSDFSRNIGPEQKRGREWECAAENELHTRGKEGNTLVSHGES